MSLELALKEAGGHVCCNELRMMSCILPLTVMFMAVRMCAKRC